MSHLVTKYASHSQRVCRLYKMAIKECRNSNVNRLQYRFDVIMLRARFDQHANVTDPMLARKLLAEGEEELYKFAAAVPYNFPDSPGGKNYDRKRPVQDRVLDRWSPIEKAQYPEYFAKRRLRKKEYLMEWHKRFGRSEAHDH